MAEEEKKGASREELMNIYMQETGTKPWMLSFFAQEQEQKFNEWLKGYNKRTREEESKTIEPQMRAMRGLLFQRQLDRTGGVRFGKARNPYEGPTSPADREAAVSASTPGYTPEATPVTFNKGENNRRSSLLDPLGIVPGWWERSKQQNPFGRLLGKEPGARFLKDTTFPKPKFKL